MKERKKKIKNTMVFFVLFCFLKNACAFFSPKFDLSDDHCLVGNVFPRLGAY